MISRVLKSTQIKNGAIFTFFSFCNNGVSFILLLILARFINPSEYGQLNLFNTFIQLFSIFICLGSTGFVGVSFFKKNKEELCKTINTVFIIAAMVLLFLLLVLAIFSTILERIVGLDVKYQWVALFICFFQVFNSINLDIWRLEERPVAYGIYSLSSVLLNFIITLVLVIGFNEGWLGRLHAQTFVAIIYFLISIGFLIKRNYIIWKWPTKVLFKETLHFGIPLIPHQASGWLKQGADRFIINYFLTTMSVGLFSFSMNFANIIYIFSTSFNATNSVYIYKNLANGYLACKNKLKRQELIMMLLFAILSMSICLICYIFIPILVPNYTESTKYLFPLCLSAMFGSYYTLYVNYLFFYERTKQLMLITLSASLLQLLLSLLFTKYGLIYTAYFTLLTQFLTFVAVYIYSRNLLKEISINENNL